MKIKVLLVEDDEISAFVATRLLGKKQCCSKIDVAKNGQDALDYLSDCKSQGQLFPDLILLDVNMPLMDAYEFLDRYIELDVFDTQKTHLVLLSTEPSRLKGDKAKVLVSRHVVKPLTMEKLEEILETIYQA